MNRSAALSTLLAALLAWTLPTRAVAEQAPRKPNVVIVLADDLGYADLGFQGSKDIPTPYLDALAKGGVRCTQGYVTHPFCSPTRAALLTGRYQQRFGHENNPVYDPDNTQLGLPLDQVTVADALKAAGYATGCVGKWHLGAAPAFHPNRRGFDHYFGLLGGGHQYFEHNTFKTDPKKARQEYFIPLRRNQEPVEEHEYLTDALGREAVAFVERNKDKPFFLYLAFNAPHTPLQAPPKYLDRVKGIADERRRTYAAMICGLDDAVGRLLGALRRHRLDRDTLVFFLSDNGGQTSLTPPIGSRNDPLRGSKGQVYEGGIRVPFVASWPARMPQGATYEQPVSCLDLFPTAVAAAGGRVPDKVRLDGVNLLPYLTGETKSAPHERLFWRTGGGASYAVREGRYKLLKQGDGTPELYDLQADTAENRNLVQQLPDIAQRLQKAYASWSAELVPPKWDNPRPNKPKK